MAKIKYVEGAEPLLNEHDGYTFQPNHYGQSMFPASRSARKRYGAQWNRQHNNQKAVTRWRDMPQATKDLWALFAATYPQPSKRNPDKFLSGYQLFIKRNSYCFLNYGINTEFMLEPEFIEIPDGSITFEIDYSEDAIDITENYIEKFGILPEIGDYMILYAHIYNEYSGQFFEPVSQVIRVDDIYMDGLFISISIPDEMSTATVSVYLSKVFHQSVKYAGTKCRYMGCFTKKRFKDLIDTPSSYAGQAGKFPKVKDDESGLEFGDVSGGGGTAPDTISSSTNNTQTESVHTHKLNQVLPSQKTSVFATITCDIKGRVIAHSSGNVPDAIWNNTSLNINKTSFSYFGLPATTLNYDMFMINVFEYAYDDRTNPIGEAQIFAFVSKSGTTILGSRLNFTFNNLVNSFTPSFVFVGSNLNLWLSHPAKPFVSFQIAVANLGH